MRSKSCPAKKAVRSILSTLEYSETPFILSASVTIKPLNPNFFFNKPCITSLDSEVGKPRFVMLGTFKCATITEDNPLSIKVL